MFRSSFTHSNSGKWSLYSREYGICDIGKYDLIWFDLIWFDLIWFDLIWLDIPNLTENNIHYGSGSFECTVDLQATSTFPFPFPFPFSRFRCSCSRKSNSNNADRLDLKLEKTAFPSLAERGREFLPLWKSSFVLFGWISVVCLIAICN